MTPMDLAKRACWKELGQIDYRWIAMWLDKYALEATIRALPRPRTSGNLPVRPSVAENLPPVPSDGGLPLLIPEGVQDLTCSDG